MEEKKANMEATAQEATGNAAEARELKNEELKDVAGGWSGKVGTVSPPSNRGVFRCPHCGWNKNYVFSYTAAGVPSCAALAQSEHNAATSGSCTAYDAVVLDETTIRKHYSI